MDNYFHPTLYQNQYEVEYSRGRGDRPARTGFDNNVFPGYSMNGYVEFSTAQVSFNKWIQFVCASKQTCTP